MAGNKSIRITKNDRAIYQRLVSSAKSKISRTNKKYGVDLSDQIGLPKLEDFSSRETFNRWKKEVENFTSKNNQNYQFVKNQYGVVASKAQINAIKVNTKIAQKKAKAEIKRVQNKPFISGGKKQGTVGQRMMQMKTPKGGITVPKNFEFSSVRSLDRLNEVANSMKNKTDDLYYDRRMEQMKTNFLEMLAKCFNSDANSLIKEIMNISAEDFYELYLMYDEFSFEKYYNESDLGVVDDAVTAMLGITEAFNDGLISLDLKSIPNK